MAASILSSLVGFGLQIVTAHYYGTRAELDAFINAATIPVVLFSIFNGTIVSALVPTFSEYMSLGKIDELRVLGSTVINGLFLSLTGLATLGWFFAPLLVHVFAHGFPPAEQRLEVGMLRCLMPGIVATSLSGVLAALLNAQHRFIASALIWVAANFVTIAVVVLFHQQLGIFALVIGTVIGLFVQLAVQFPSVLHQGLYGFKLDLRHPGLRKTWALLVPIAIGAGAFQISTAFDRYFASTLSAGSTSAIGYTTKLAFLPVSIVAGAIGTVIFPVLAGQFTTSDRAGVRRSISLAIRMVGFIAVPSAVGLTTLAYPIVQTLFERGAFGRDSTALCASLVPYACISLIAISYNTVMDRACYACKESRRLAIGSFFVVVINIALSVALLPFLGARGLLLANGVSMSFGTIYLIVVLWSLLDGLEWKPLFLSLGRVWFASLVMGGALHWILTLGFMPATTVTSRACYLLGLIAVGAAIYLGISRVLGGEELSIVIRTFMRKFSGRAGIASTSESRSIA